MFHKGRGILPRFPARVSVRYLPYTRWLPAGRLWRRDLPWDGQYRYPDHPPRLLSATVVFAIRIAEFR